MTLWQASSKSSKRVEAFTVGKDPELDKELLPYDVEGSKAHVDVLKKAGILTAQEAASLHAMLEEILAAWQQGNFTITQEQEDCHTAIEELLTEKLGSLGKKIHTGRSRNDQVATVVALYMKAQLATLKKSIGSLTGSLEIFAKQQQGIALPGYTHMQQGMLSTVELWALSYVEMLGQDAVFLEAVAGILDKSPLGTAAGYGPSITLDRELAAKKLGFASLIKTAPAVQGLRGKNEALALMACQQTMATLGKLATDLLLFTTKEFGYMRVAEGFCTGSSIMPQKKNPDVLELVRAKAAVVNAKLNEVQLIALNLPSGYNRDFQLLKEPLFAGMATTLASVEMMAAVIDGVSVDAAAIMAKLSPEIIAADKATALAASGVPFRDAYLQVKEELADLHLSQEEILENIKCKRTIGAPGNP